MVAYPTGSDYIEIGDLELGSKVKVTVTFPISYLMNQVTMTLADFQLKKKIIENCTILMPKENSYFRRKSSARDYNCITFAEKMYR